MLIGVNIYNTQLWNSETLPRFMETTRQAVSDKYHFSQLLNRKTD